MNKDEEISTLKRRIAELERTEIKLKETENRFRGLASASFEGIIITTNGMAIDVNEHLLNMTGYVRDEIVGQHVVEMMVAPEFADLVKNHIRENWDQMYEIVLIKKDGSRLPVEVRGKSVELDGVPSRLTAIRDISGRKKVETDLRESEERWRKLMDMAADPIILHQGGKFIYVNAACARMIGAKSADDMLGTPVINVVHPDSKQEVSQRMKKMMETGEPPPMMEEKLIHYDGEVIYVEASSTPIMLHGRLVGQAIVRDITGRKKLERELLDSQERYQRLVENAPDAIAVHQDGKLVLVNDAAVRIIAGNSKDDLVGKPIMQFVHPDCHAMVKENVGKMIKTGLPMPTVEEKYVRLDGKVIFAEVSSAPITYQGRPAFQAILRDVTKRKDLEASLLEAKETAEKATELKDKFVGIVAHDLKSPFTAITGMLQIIKFDTETPLAPAHLTLVERALGACDGLIEVIDNVLDLSRFKSGKITPSKKRLSCNIVTEENFASLKYLAEVKGISLQNAVPAQMRVFADQVLFGACVSNLLSNAIKFSNKGGEITVFNPAGMKTTVAVRDNGVGIQKNMVPRLFEAGVKTYNLGTAGERGTGLGLPFCRDVMEAHGGTIKFETNEGKGTTFYLTFPDVKPLVLVVDDDPVVRLLTCKYLDDLDVETKEAIDGMAALEIMETAVPNVVITDINMPRMGGVEFVKALKSSQKNKNVPVIAMTGDEKMKVEGLDVRTYMIQLGCEDFTNKPFAQHDILPRVQRLIGTYSIPIFL